MIEFFCFLGLIVAFYIRWSIKAQAGNDFKKLNPDGAVYINFPFNLLSDGIIWSILLINCVINVSLLSVISTVTR